VSGGARTSSRDTSSFHLETTFIGPVGRRSSLPVDAFTTRPSLPLRKPVDELRGRPLTRIGLLCYPAIDTDVLGNPFHEEHESLRA
jgi:hypothetical protein